jgi:hypothetical protein
MGILCAYCPTLRESERENRKERSGKRESEREKRKERIGKRGDIERT